MQSQNQPVSSLDKMLIPATMIPNFRTTIALQNGVDKNLLFRTWGGIGDEICTEPTLRYALKVLGKSCSISLAAERPEFFEHLKFKRVFNLKEETPNQKNYLVFETITPPDDSNLVWQFFSHMLTNCVDFPSLCALRCQLPIEDRVIKLSSKKPEMDTQDIEGGVLIHPGRHWQSKTFPKAFWDRVIASLLTRGITPVIIGANTDDNRGTVDVNTDGCLDLRNKLKVSESVWACQNAAVLLTNDSSPLHMAASGKAFIGYVATCKHPDMITHWRLNEHDEPEWQWREKNFGKGGIWDIIDMTPNKEQEVSAEFVPPEMLLSWLPDPVEFAEWACEKVGEYYGN